MGEIKFTTIAPIDVDDAREIGLSPRSWNTSATSIVADGASGVFVYGAEVPCRAERRIYDVLRRRDGRLNRFSFGRHEITFDKRASEEHAMAAGHMVVLRPGTLGVRRVLGAPVRKAARALPRTPVEELGRELAGTPLADLDTAARAALPDTDVVRALHRCRSDLFTTGTDLTAAFLDFDVEQALGYDDEDPEEATAWAQVSVRAADPGEAVGVVADREAVRAAVMLDKRVQRLLELSETGTLEVKPADGIAIRVPAEIGYRAVDHLTIAIAQALAGPGDDSRRLGRPVAEFAADLFESHLANAARRYQRSGRVADGGLVSWDLYQPGSHDADEAGDEGEAP